MIYVFPLLLLDSSCFHPSRRIFLTYLWALTLVFFLINDFFGIYYLVPLGIGYYTGVNTFIAASGFNQFQSVALNLLSLLVTASLIQLADLIARQRTDWTPWLCVPFFRLWRWWHPAAAAPPS
jgi:hypothetical protein